MSTLHARSQTVNRPALPAHDLAPVVVGSRPDDTHTDIVATWCARFAARWHARWPDASPRNASAADVSLLSWVAGVSAPSDALLACVAEHSSSMERLAALIDTVDLVASMTRPPASARLRVTAKLEAARAAEESARCALVGALITERPR